MRLIDADALKAIMPTIEDEYKYAHKLIDDAPTVDAMPVKHGRWIGAESQCGIGCPFCGTPVDDFCNSIDYIYLIYEPNYCPNCGAKMDAERKEE